MFYNDHTPPHFHARYGAHKAIVSIDDQRVIEGSLPPRALGLVVEWAAIHRSELLEDWKLARDMAPLRPVPPLE